LKTYWLDGKRNRQIDHLIYILTQEMLLDHYESWQRTQEKMGKILKKGTAAPS